VTQGEADADGGKVAEARIAEKAASFSARAGPARQASAEYQADWPGIVGIVTSIDSSPPNRGAACVGRPDRPERGKTADEKRRPAGRRRIAGQPDKTPGDDRPAGCQVDHGHGRHSPKPSAFVVHSLGRTAGPTNTIGQLPLGLIPPARSCQPAG
jgi:hypothetical protein